MLKQILETERITQTKLAETLKTSRSDVNRNIKRGINKVNVLKRYCNAINKLAGSKWNWWELAD